MKTLVYVEDREGEPSADSLGAVSKAAQLGGDVAAVVCGSEVAALAPILGNCGATRVYVADSPALEAPLPQPRVDVLAGLFRDQEFDNLLFATSVLTADVASGLAARLEAGLNWGLSDLERRGDTLVGKRLALGDSVLLDVGWKGAPRLALIRPGSFEQVATGGRAEVEQIRVEIDEWSARTVMLQRASHASEGPSIEDADVIVAGGRGIGSRESVALLEELADALGGVVAGTMPVVDAGWLPYSAQVGQTGKTVRPKLYVSCGVSGAIQHRVGMDGSGKIIAINQDPKAPIFDFCDLGIVGDLHQVVPKLTQLLRTRAAE